MSYFFYNVCTLNFWLKFDALLYALKEGWNTACACICDGCVTDFRGSRISLRMFTYFFLFIFSMKIFLYSIYNAL